MAGIEDLGALDGEEGGAGGAEQSDEVFRDQQKKTQAQIKAIKKAEASAKQKDHRLAGVLGKFLQSHSNTQIMLLIARCLDHNIPAGLILGLLALVEPEAQEEFEKLMGEAVQLLQAPAEGTHALVEQSEFSAEHLPQHVKLAIDSWGRGLLEFGLTQPTRLLATAWSPEKELFPSLAQLATFLLRQYLATEKINAEYDSTHAFAELLLRNVLTKISEQLGETKELGSGETD
jgi:hypothetical protein